MLLFIVFTVLTVFTDTPESFLLNFADKNLPFALVGVGFDHLPDTLESFLLSLDAANFPLDPIRGVAPAWDNSGELTLPCDDEEDFVAPGGRCFEGVLLLSEKRALGWGDCDRFDGVSFLTVERPRERDRALLEAFS